MPIVPVRGLAEKGILADPSPYQLDLNAWSAGSNVRFHANKAEKAPIYRVVLDTLVDAPVHLSGLQPTSGYDSVIIATDDFRIFKYGSGTLTDITPTGGYVPSSDPRSYTSTFLGDVLYFNRPERAPAYYIDGTSSEFAPLPNMETTWTCRSLRAYGDYLIALNVTYPSTYVDPHTGLTITGGAKPTMFKWSDLALIGQVPGSWDPFDPTKNTGENPLEELTTPIVDGLPMRETFIIYSETQVWSAQQNGGASIFTFRKVFNEGGMLSPNCGVEVDGVHYVFGPKDIYKHDGVQKVSIVDKRNKNFIYRNLNKQKAEVAFVSYWPQYNSIVFAYNSGEHTAAFPNTTYCNFGAVYDLSADTWSFVDLPNVASFTQANLDNILTYASVPAAYTYENIGGTYYDQDNTYVKHVVSCSAIQSGLFTKDRLTAYDFFDKGALAYPYEPEINAPAFLERTGIALDSLGSDLTTWKKVRRIFPLVTTFNGASLLIEVGGSATPSGPVTYSDPVSFDPATQYKVDGIKGGRYLALRFTGSTADDFEIAGYDLDVIDGGRR